MFCPKMLVILLILETVQNEGQCRCNFSDILSPLGRGSVHSFWYQQILFSSDLLPLKIGEV